ncbi:hypothetical protein N2152v2_002832 [Parachlorella kessleri]
MVLRLLWLRVVIVSDPVLVSQVLSRKANANKPAILSLTNPLISAQGHPGLFSATDSQSPYWKAVRRGTATAFNPYNLRQGFKHVVSTALEVCDVIKSVGDSRSVDIDNLLIREALDVIGKVGFNHDFETVKGYLSQTQGDAFYRVNKGLEEVTYRITNPLRKHLTFLPSVREGERHFRAFQSHMVQLLDTLKARGPPADDDASLGAHLLRLQDPLTGGPLPDERLLPEIATFFIAGFDTTGHTMAWTLYLLSRHPEAEARVCQELEEYGLLASPANPTPRLVEYEDLSKLVFLSACVKESMRMLPVTAEASSRCFSHDVSIGGYTIPVNTWIWTYFLIMQRSPKVWEEPDAYLPERWLQPGAEYYNPPGAADHAAGTGDAGATDKPLGTEVSHASKGTSSLTPDTPSSKHGTCEQSADEPAGPAVLPPAERALRWLPFSAGPRDCLGQNMAKMNYMATLAVLLGRYRFRLAPEMEGPGGVQEVIKLTLQPASGIPMLCTPRA